MTDNARHRGGGPLNERPAGVGEPREPRGVAHFPPIRGSQGTGVMLLSDLDSHPGANRGLTHEAAMSEARHTPGPWALSIPAADDVFDEWHDDDQRRRTTCFAGISGSGWTGFAFVMVYVGGEPDDTGLANARLIAACPQMLAALEACERAMDTAAIAGVGNILAPAYRDAWAAAHQDTKAAIARATGERP